MVVTAIASNTLRQVIRQNLFYNVLIFGIGLVAVGMVVSNMTFSYTERVIRSIGLSGCGIALNLIGLLVGASLVYQEIDKRTLFVTLTRPVPRWKYLIGRYLGLLAALACALGGLALAFTIVMMMVGSFVSVSDFVALGMSLVESAVIAGFALMLSCFSTPTVSGGIGLGFWLACSATDDLVRLTKDASEVLQTGAKALYWVLPSLSRFNFRAYAVYEKDLPWDMLSAALGYGALYAVAFVLASSAILSRREMI